MKLTEQQVHFFNTFGYLAFPKLFSSEEIAVITKDFEYSIDNFGGGKNHDGSRRTMLGGPIECLPSMCKLLDDPRIQGIIGGVIGEDFIFCSGDGNYYSGDTAWHPDGSWNLLTPVKVAFYLDPVGPETGCLRVIPGSFEKEHFIHRKKIHPNDAQKLFGIHPKDFPGNVPLVCEPGDVVMFNHDTWHAAYGGSNRRRMFTLNCHRRARTPEEFQALRQWIFDHFLLSGRALPTASKIAFRDAMRETASPQRMKRLEQTIRVYDDVFKELTAQAAAGKPIHLTSKVKPVSKAAKSRSGVKSSHRPKKRAKA